MIDPTAHTRRSRRGRDPSAAELSQDINSQRRLRAGRYHNTAARPAQALRATGGERCLFMTTWSSSPPTYRPTST